MTDSARARAREGRGTAPVVHIRWTDDRALADLLRRAGLPGGRPVVVLIGGAGGLTDSDRDACESVLVGALIPAVEAAGAVLVDGGTDAGIIRLTGRSRNRLRARSPHVGVVAEGTVRWRGGPGGNPPSGSAELEPHHSHIVAVPGQTWGDEGRWISAVAAALSAGAPSVTVLANGGEIAFEDVRRSLTAGRRVLVSGGTGRAAAQLAQACAGLPADARAVALAGHPLLTVLPEDLEELRSTLTDMLGGMRPAGLQRPPVG